MSRTGIEKAFRRLGAVEQADVLKALAAALAESLSEEDRIDDQVFERRQHEEADAQQWSQVRARINARHARKRATD